MRNGLPQREPLLEDGVEWHGARPGCQDGFRQARRKRSPESLRREERLVLR